MIPCRGRLDIGPLDLELGGRLPRVEIAFETWGRLAPGGGNAILVCHALTGDAHVASHDPEDRPGWWEGAVGPGKPIDTRRWFVLCTNVLGGCYGSTGPASPVPPVAGDQHPGRGSGEPTLPDAVQGGGAESRQGAGPHVPALPEAARSRGTAGAVAAPDGAGAGPVPPGSRSRYGSRFPVVTVRDMVRAQARLLDALGIGRLALVVGGSLGGMQALEWAVSEPERVAAAAVLAAPPAASPHAIAWNEAQRQAIFADPAWRGGDYPPEDPPRRGLAIARMLAMTTYRGRGEWQARFGRQAVEPGDDPVARRLGAYSTAPAGEGERFRFQVESYLHYQGEKLVRRFDAGSYVVLTRAMDLHDVGAGRGGLEAAAARVRARVYVLSITSDLLYPVEEQRVLVRALRRAGKDVTWHVWRAPWGHDSFLVDPAGVARRVMSWLEEPARQRRPLRQPGRPEPLVPALGEGRP